MPVQAGAAACGARAAVWVQGQLLGDGRCGPLRPLLGDPLRPHRRPRRGAPRQHGRPQRAGDLEHRLYPGAVHAHKMSILGTAEVEVRDKPLPGVAHIDVVSDAHVSS